MKAIAMTQHDRNQLSILSWIVAAFCAWLLFMSAAALAGSHPSVTTAAEVPVIATK